jgi:hypothetical protein
MFETFCALGHTSSWLSAYSVGLRDGLCLCLWRSKGSYVEPGLETGVNAAELCANKFTHLHATGRRADIRLDTVVRPPTAGRVAWGRLAPS